MGKHCPIKHNSYRMKGKIHCYAEVQAWVFKTEMTLAVSRYIEILIFIFLVSRQEYKNSELIHPMH